MVKRVLSLALGMFLIGSFLVSLICFVCITGYAKAETHYVNPGESIQTAIDNAQSGDTVIVNSGTYFENITITKQIKLEGESASATIINGGGVAFGIQIYQTDSVIIKALTLKNSNTAISIFSSNDTKIEGVVIKECGTGIDANNDIGLRIRECEFTGYGIGTAINAFQIDDLKVENNTVEVFLNGMSLRHSDDSYVYGNSVVSNLDNGIIMEHFSGGILKNNYIANHDTNGIKINHGDGIEISDNIIFNITNKGLFVSWSNFKVTSISIEDSGYGVYFMDISNGEILNSSISNSNIADLYVSLDDLELTNTTFDHSKVIIAKQDAILSVKNYLDIIVVDSQEKPIEGAGVQVKKNQELIYDSVSGSDEDTNEHGTIGFIPVTWGIYQYDSSSNYSLSKNVIGAEVIYNSFQVPFQGADPDEIDMSESRKALFIVDIIAPQISDVSSKGNVSQTLNTLDRGQDDSLGISFSADEPGGYIITIDSDKDGEFNESMDAVISGSSILGPQTIYWDGSNQSGLLKDGFYKMEIKVYDEFNNWILQPHDLITIIIVNSDLDGDGRLDINDDLPDDPTQWFDNDGDGYGDNPKGDNADLFPQDPTQWFDSDGDGHGDNPEGTNYDGDGFGDNISGEDGDAFPEDETQWLDSDSDGWGDNQSGNKPDLFPDNILEWVDSDGDGRGDNGDAFPEDSNEWKDSDSDGMGDNSDFLPTVNNWLLFLIIGITVVIVLAGLYVFKRQKISERPFDPGVSSQPQAEPAQTQAVAAKPTAKPSQEKKKDSVAKPKPSKGATPKKKVPGIKKEAPRAKPVKPEPGKEAPLAKPVSQKEPGEVPMVGVAKPSSDTPPPPPPPPPEEDAPLPKKKEEKKED